MHSTPDISGIWMSISTTRGRQPGSACNASTPLAQAQMHLKPGVRSSQRLRFRRTVGLSSTTATVMGASAQAAPLRRQGGCPAQPSLLALALTCSDH